MVIVGLVFAFIGLLALVASAVRIVRRALPTEEQLAFQQAGSETQWTIQGIAALPGPIGGFAREVLECSADADRVDLLCERLASIDLDTDYVEQRVNMLARCALAITAVTFVGGATSCLQHPTLPAIVGVVILSFSGLFSGLFCWRIGRQTKTAIDQRRRDWDQVAQLLLSSTSTGPFEGDPNRARNPASTSHLLGRGLAQVPQEGFAVRAAPTTPFLRSDN
ncbi:MAG TPA: hypothetical protein VKP30_28105 [Polyangiaceae bacterium]|nr:hypothetical protein [Polyangiaceae bacterium]